MNSLLFLLSTAAAVLAVPSLPTISNPTTHNSCSTVAINFGGNGPFTLGIFNAGNTAYETFPGLTGTQYLWHIAEPPNTVVRLHIVDSNSLSQSTGTFTIQASTNGVTTVPQKTLPGPGQCLSGDVGTTLASASTCASLTANGSTFYVGSTTYACCDSIPAGTFICTTPPPPPDCTANGGTVTQKTLPGAGQCNSGDTGTTLASTSTCASLTSDGSTIYVDSSVDVCCNSIPSGTFVCNTPVTPPPPTCDFVPTNAAATTECLASERSITLTAATTCDFLTSFRGSTTADYYTVSGSNICCDSIPAGTTICVPASTPSTSTCPTTTTTTTATQTSTGTATTTTAPPAGPSGYLGCYVDSVDARVLPNQMGVAQVTTELCQSTCASAGYEFAGLEWSQECWCGHSVPTTLATDGRCSMTCAGNSQEICGGGNGISVYSTGSNPSTLQSYNSWSYTGCYEDSIAARTMPTTVTTIDGNAMTVEKCLDACHTLGHSYAGLEYSQECYCADALPPTQVTDGRCDMPCKGNGLEYCGGGNGLTVYTYSYAPIRVRRRAF